MARLQLLRANHTPESYPMSLGGQEEKKYKPICRDAGFSAQICCEKFLAFDKKWKPPLAHFCSMSHNFYRVCGNDESIASRRQVASDEAGYSECVEAAGSWGACAQHERVHLPQHRR